VLATLRIHWEATKVQGHIGSKKKLIWLILGCDNVNSSWLFF
ncbi:unnamed protein product, partial [Acidithrix sp. C25]